MPWRTALEVARRMAGTGHDVRLFSLDRSAQRPARVSDQGLPVWHGATWADLIRAAANEDSEACCPDLVYRPVTWRSGLRVGGPWPQWKGPTVVYHGGSCYNAAHVLGALRFMPGLPPRDLLAETLVPKGLLVRRLGRRGVAGVICMTDFTRRAFVRAGWPGERIVAVPPGLPPQGPIEKEAPCIWEVDRLSPVQPYVLFLGNPLPVRGIDVLLSAARRVFSSSPGARIVCLLRPDPGRGVRIARDGLLRRVAGLGMGNRFICVVRDLSPEEVRRCLRRARAAVMPFLVVPSEIPLAVLEAMQSGTPVITSRSGGVSEFVGEGGWIVPPASVTLLAEAILSALHDDRTRSEKAERCSAIMAHHPTWEAVGDRWLEFGSSVSGR